VRDVTLQTSHMCPIHDICPIIIAGDILLGVDRINVRDVTNVPYMSHICPIVIAGDILLGVDGINVRDLTLQAIADRTLGRSLSTMY